MTAQEIARMMCEDMRRKGINVRTFDAMGPSAQAFMIGKAREFAASVGVVLP